MARFRVLNGLLLGLTLAFAAPAQVKAEGVVNASGWTGAAIEGYDPVAYFEQGRPVEGDGDYSHEWMGATWYFASAANRDLFAADPEKYAPQYGGYCAWAVANGYTAEIDPQAWAVVDDKLYLNYSPDVQTQWQAGRAGQHRQGGRQLAGHPRRPRRLTGPLPRRRRRTSGAFRCRGLDLPVTGMSISRAPHPARRRWTCTSTRSARKPWPATRPRRIRYAA